MRQERGVNMNSRPRVDIIGSCVSRDVFNSRFNDVYKEHVEIGATVYQAALPSIVERSMIPDINDTGNPKTIFKKTLDEEFSGNSIDRIMASRPDFIVIDFFADIHFGVTRKMGRYITRNHMAFQTLDDAGVFMTIMKAPLQKECGSMMTNTRLLRLDRFVIFAIGYEASYQK